MKDLQGHEISSADVHSKVVLIDFWATRCQPCKKEMSGYQKLLGRYGSQGFAVVGFNIRHHDGYRGPGRLRERIGVRYPLAIAADDLKQKFGGVEGLPTTLIYDCKGILRNKVVGFIYTDVIESEIKLQL